MTSAKHSLRTTNQQEADYSGVTSIGQDHRQPDLQNRSQKLIKKQGRYNKKRYNDEKQSLQTGDDVEPYVANVMDFQTGSRKESARETVLVLPDIGSNNVEEFQQSFMTEIHDLKAPPFSKSLKNFDQVRKTTTKQGGADTHFFSLHSNLKSHKSTHMGMPPAASLGAVPIAFTPRSSNDNSSFRSKGLSSVEQKVLANYNS